MFYHSQWYKTPTDLANLIDFSPLIPRIFPTMRHRSNMAAETEILHFRRNMVMSVSNQVS